MHTAGVDGNTQDQAATTVSFKRKKNRNNCQILLATVLSLLLQLLLTVDWLRFLVKRSGLMPFKQAMLHKGEELYGMVQTLNYPCNASVQSCTSISHSQVRLVGWS